MTGGVLDQPPLYKKGIISNLGTHYLKKEIADGKWTRWGSPKAYSQQKEGGEDDMSQLRT